MIRAIRGEKIREIREIRGEKIREIRVIRGDKKPCDPIDPWRKKSVRYARSVEIKIRAIQVIRGDNKPVIRGEKSEIQVKTWKNKNRPKA